MALSLPLQARATRFQHVHRVGGMLHRGLGAGHRRWPYQIDHGDGARQRLGMLCPQALFAGSLEGCRAPGMQSAPSPSCRRLSSA